VSGFCWQRHPGGPFAMLVAGAATCCSAGAYDGLRVTVRDASCCAGRGAVERVVARVPAICPCIGCFQSVYVCYRCRQSVR